MSDAPMTTLSSLPSSRPTVLRAGVIGWPIAHSRSPLIHGHWLSTLQIAGSYERIAVPPSDIQRFLVDLPTSGLVGCNVTVPHKEAAFAAADRLDDVALAIGAVNTLWLEDGQRLATNTDGPGFLANLDDTVPKVGDARPGDALVLGAGGAASGRRLWALKARGFTRPPRQSDARPRRAADLPDRLGSDETRAHGWDDVSGDLARRVARLLVNTTSLGMTGKERHDDRHLTGSLPGDALVTDIVYVPLDHPAPRRRPRPWPRRPSTGSACCCIRRSPGFERWFGVTPDGDARPCDASILDRSRSGRHDRSSASPDRSAWARRPRPTSSRAAGVPVHDADATVHASLSRARRAPLIEAAFPGHHASTACVDRAKPSRARVLGDDAAALKRLEAIVHPLGARRRDAPFSTPLPVTRPGATIVVLDIPLLFETGGDARVDARRHVVTAPGRRATRPRPRPPRA